MARAFPGMAKLLSKTFSMALSVMVDSVRSFVGCGGVDAVPAGSDAAAGLGDAADLGRELGRALGEQLVQLLDGHSRGLAQGADGRRVAGLQVLVPQVEQPLRRYAMSRFGLFWVMR